MHPGCYQLYGVKKEKKKIKWVSIILFSSISPKSKICLKILIDIHEYII